MVIYVIFSIHCFILYMYFNSKTVGLFHSMTWFERYQFFNNLEKINLPTCVPLVSRKNIKWKQNEVLVIETLILPWIFVCYFNRKWREDKTSAYKYVSWKCVFPSQQSTHLISIWNVHQITQWTHLISWGRKAIAIYGNFVNRTFS